ncbi:LCP family protein [Candidatus Saccharibacteria bacterium]|nr:LCP family protein [Candidatus Saccharibacteria bacterium]
MDNFKTPKNQYKKPNIEGIITSPSIERKPKQSNTEPDIFLPNTSITDQRKSNQDTLKTTSLGFSLNPTPDNTRLNSDNIAQKPKPKRLSFKKVFRFFRPTKKKFVILLVIAGLLVGALTAKGYLNLRNIFKGGADGAAALSKDIDPSKLNGEGDGRVNILLLGRGGEGETAPDLTDTIVVASIDPVNNKVALLSIPRDLWVRSQTGESSKINALFANAKYAATDAGKTEEQAEDEGFRALKQTVTETMGIPIHYHTIIDFSGFKEAIDTLGGVDINVDKNGEVYEILRDHSTGSDYILDVEEGLQHFDGRKALFYSRSRYTSARGDFDRAERQRKVMIALKDKILTLGTFANPAKVSGLMSSFGNHVQTNMSIKEVMRLYEIASMIDSGSIVSVGLADPPNEFVTTDMIDGQSVVVPRSGINDFDEIKSYVRNTLKDGFIQKEDPEVIVLNGTNIAGLATDQAEILKSYGYRVTSAVGAPTTDYTDTVLIDLRNGEKKYTKHYLEKRFGVTATTSIPEGIMTGTADFVIILGSNENNSQ